MESRWDTLLIAAIASLTAAFVQSLYKSFEVSDLPSRCAKFVPRKQWVAIGSDDMLIRVFNYNTMDREKSFEAHADYIRSLAVHPSLPYLLSCSDDMLIKLWDWDKGWQCTQVFEGHAHYVMQARFQPLFACRLLVAFAGARLAGKTPAVRAARVRATGAV